MERMVRELMKLLPNAALAAVHAWAPEYSIAGKTQRFYEGQSLLHARLLNRTA